METSRFLFVLMLYTSYLLRDGCADITPLTKNYEAELESDLQLIWNFEYENDSFSIEWSFQNKTSSSPTAVMVKFTPAAAVKVDLSFNIRHDSNGNVTIESVKRDNEGTYYCTVEYNAAKYPPVIGTAVVTIATSAAEEIYDCPLLGNGTAVDTVGECVGCWFGICCVIYLVVSVLIGIVLGCILIGVLAKCCCVCFHKVESCEDCVDNYYCKCKCCPTPCGACCNIRGLPSWYQVLWASIFGIPVAFGIWLVWTFSEQSNNDTSRNAVGTGSNPKNAGTKLLDKKKPSKSPGKADDVNKEKHASVKQHQQDDQPQKNHLENEGKKAVRPQPPPPAGANPSREGSGSVVSGRDVEVQDTDTSFKKSQLPNIHATGHDSKGRGLSSNFEDDDHPLAGVDTPAQKAGALPTITDTPREEKKKTKKKKKEKQEEF